MPPGTARLGRDEDCWMAKQQRQAEEQGQEQSAVYSGRSEVKNKADVKKRKKESEKSGEEEESEKIT